jgi:hypothetical protein
MTKAELHNLPRVALWQALRLAFDAGCSYGIASHKDFVQTHEDCETVCSTLHKRVLLDHERTDVQVEFQEGGGAE